jgi:hypothetical protein
LRPRNARRRSAAVTLVLAGTLSGCGQPDAQRDVYVSQADCLKDWNEPQACEPVRDGRASSSYYYGPHYFGSTYPSGRPRPNRNAIEAVRTAGLHTGTASSRQSYSSSGVQRSGFGSSARSFTSSGG